MSGAASALPELGLLLSDKVDAEHGQRLDALALAAGRRLRRCRVSSAEPASIDIAFFSRDLYEGSSLRKPGPESDAFFRLADAAPRLRWLHVCSSGLDLPQYASSLARGVPVTSSTGVTAGPIAQTAVAAILAQSRGFDRWLPSQARREWAPLTAAARPADLDTLHVLVLGAGAIGLEIGRLCKAVGLRATAVRREAKPTPGFHNAIAFDQLDEALPHCDWLVLALPLTQSTAGLMDARRLALLPRRARIANVARGELIDETALAEALAAGHLAGAYLDTFIDEPLPADSPLWALPSVWISPHNSAASLGHEGRVVDCFTEHFQRWLQIPG
ncbi:NAD(P)-dependent oxidoreductase [Achromobacter seleniivolatilans]|uniref:NAD(P)-dependent oxidoreductase n=1 Tax=Achromobacter seleniivolatilans TaxID=3047478 RepID=A0ABY9M0R8_9BURK|nr:NAD(P)-dependent oxidoreductase [Achromobacter sp. R39]WMD20295.1 NAD(P)-dependent oxidoreductase [Achromobacter sp. R39]